MISAKPSQNVTPPEKSNEISAGAEAHTLHNLNLLPADERRLIYTELIPDELVQRFDLPAGLVDQDGRDLLLLNCPTDGSTVEMAVFHKAGFPDPLLYGHITDTFTGHVHILLYVLNDPTSPRFDVDRLPDGSPSNFGSNGRNLQAEQAAMEYGLAPGQIRRGLRLLGPAIQAFERFVAALGHDMYFADPLHYHNAVIFEEYGFNYQKGRRRMERIQQGFQPGGDLLPLLDGSTPFRQPDAANSIRLRSWAIHDGLLGEPFTEVTMYKRIDQHAGIDTRPGCGW